MTARFSSTVRKRPSLRRPPEHHEGLDEWDAAQERDRKKQEDDARGLLDVMRGNFETDQEWLVAMVTDPNLKDVPRFRETCRKVASERGLDLKALIASVVR